MSLKSNLKSQSMTSFISMPDPSNRRDGDPSELYRCPIVHSALSILQEEEKPEQRMEGKEISPLKDPSPVYSLSILKAARSVFQPGKVYRFRTIRTAGLTSSGAGLMQLATGITPSNMSTYGSLNALFLECRLRSTRIQYTFLSNGTLPIPQSFCSSFDPSNASTAPSFVYACQMPGAKLMSITNFGNGTSVARNSWKATQPRPWSSVMASASGGDPVGGILGTWYHSLAAATSITSVVAQYLIECDYEFRNPV